MNCFVRTAAISCFMFLSIINAYAGDSIGEVNILGVNRFDEVLVQTDGVENFAECATFKRYVLDLSTEHGRSMYALILSVQAQGKKLRIVGKGVCDIRSDGESIQYMELVK